MVTRSEILRFAMSAENQPTAYGRIFPPREEWLAGAPAEAILEPGIAIVDTHHHLWSERGRYLVEEFLADSASGHNVEATVFIECRTNYLRADFRDGLNRLTAMGLSLDALVYHHQHSDLIDLARACPDANI